MWWMFAACLLISDEKVAADLDPDGDGVLYPVDCDDHDPTRSTPEPLSVPTFLHGEFDGAGTYSASADMDGDGTTDLLVGTDQGLLVIRGPVQGELPFSTHYAAISRVEDPGNDPFFPDISGDGYDDLAILSVNSEYNDVIYLIHGPVSGIIDAGIRAETTIFSPLLDDETLFSDLLITDGDFAGDSSPDLIVALYSEVEAAAILVGPVTDGFTWTTDADGASTLSIPSFFIFRETGESSSYGSYVPERAGDVSGDGHPDLLLWSWYGDSGYLVHGPLEASMALPDADAQFLVDGSLAKLKSVHDINQDGYDDLLLIAADTSSTPHNTARLFYGPVNGVRSASDADATFYPEERTTMEHTERGVSDGASPGDMDGDGQPDLVIGADEWQRYTYEYDDTETGYLDDEGDYSWGYSFEDEGAVYVLAGPFSGAIPLCAARGWLWGGGPEVRFGEDVRDVDDVNGDGLRDVLASAPGVTDSSGNDGWLGIVALP